MKSLSRIGVALIVFTILSAASLAAGATDLEKTPQGKTYRAQAKAAAAGDYEAYKKVTMAEGVTMMEKQLKEMGKTPKDGLQLVTMLAPQDIHFTDLKVNGKKATLTMTGKSDGQMQKGSAELAEEGGQWKMGRQEWGPAK